MSDLGDLTGFLREGSVPNLAWLDVDEADYRALDKLPKQNLDFVPELEALWSHGLGNATPFVPNDARPRTMLEVGQEGLRHASLVTRVARFAIMGSDDPRIVRHALTSRFDKSVLRENQDGLRAAFAERGLLGRYYIAAFDFPTCSANNGRDAAFVRKVASRAPYILAKEACGGCSHAVDGRCGVFHKKIVLEVPYEENDAARVERVMSASGREVQASAAKEPKERIRLALSAPAREIVTPPDAPKPIEHTARNLRPVEAPKRVHLPVLASTRASLVAKELAFDPTPALSGKTASNKASFDKLAFDVTALLRREMLRGRGERALLDSMRLSFSKDEIRKTRAAWEPLFREAGYFGSVYTTQASFDVCQDGADFLVKHNSDVRAVVASDRCNGCPYNRLSRCAVYNLPLVPSPEALFTPATVAAVVKAHRMAGRIPADLALSADPKQALKEVYRRAFASTPRSPERLSVERGHVASEPVYVTAGLTKREIVKSARLALNRGLFGKALFTVLRKQFDPRDLLATQEELRPFVAEQGLLGHHYVDPTAYGDYGKGCHEAEKLHRSQKFAYLKEGPSCAECVHHTRKGFCSKVNKALAVDPPYENKAAQQQAILASVASPSISVEQAMQGRSMVAEFDLQPMTVDVEGQPTVGPTVRVSLGRSSVKL